MPNGRCANHGGKSLAWFAHPNFKHGCYSKYAFERERYRRERQARAVARDFDRAAARAQAAHPERELTHAEMSALLHGVHAYHKRRGWFVARVATRRESIDLVEL